MTSLLPPNITSLEQNLETVTSEAENVQAPLDTLWDAEEIPADILPWLGWAVGVDRWSRRWPDEAKRAAINEAIPIRRLRGTVWAVRRALEVLGYTDVEILEHARQDAEWRAAGGRYIDGAWLLNDDVILGGDLVDAPRVVTTDWAQYALAFNIAEAPFEARDQRRIRDRVEDAAPLRSELIALIYRYADRLDARITLAPLSQTVRQRWADCNGAPVHRARPLMGCWSLSGDYAPQMLDGDNALRGSFDLTGQRPIGEPLSQGWGTADIRVRQPSAIGMQTQSRETWTLGEGNVDRVDGSWSLNEVVDGHRYLSGDWCLELSQILQERRPPLDGARRLGQKDTIDAIGTTGRAVLRDRRLRQEIRL
jgi:phage tail P2-like protein